MNKLNPFILDASLFHPDVYQPRRDALLKDMGSAPYKSYAAICKIDKSPRAFLAASIAEMRAAKHIYTTLALMAVMGDLPVVEKVGFVHPDWLFRLQMIDAIMQVRAMLGLACPAEKLAFINCECQKEMDRRIVANREDKFILRAALADTLGTSKPDGRGEGSFSMSEAPVDEPADMDEDDMEVSNG